MDKTIIKNRPDSRQKLQNAVGQLFSECGFAVKLSKVIETLRRRKEIDVYAEDHSGEYKQTVLIECKQWKTSVKQETVHAFHTMMNDFGAILGFIISKSGFQAGCYDAIKIPIYFLSHWKNWEQVLSTLAAIHDKESQFS